MLIDSIDKIHGLPLWFYPKKSLKNSIVPMEMQWNYFKIKNKIINNTHMYMVKTITRLTNVMKTC